MTTQALVGRTLPDYDPGDFWDEMFEARGQVRSHYAQLAARLAQPGPDDVV